MQLHRVSKKEIKRVGIGSGICLGILLGVFFLLSLAGIVRFDHTVILGGVLGTLVAVVNFAALCVTIQKAAQMEEPNSRKTQIRLSYNGRLLLQGAWVIIAISLPWVNGIAGTVPLLFPSWVIFFLRNKARYVR